MNLETYWALSRTHTYSLLFALPLLILYELLAAAMNHAPVGGVRNMADAVLRTWLTRLGMRSSLALVAVLIVAAVVLIIREQRVNPVPFEPRYFAWMLVESALLAVVFSIMVGWATSAALAPFSAAGPADAGGAALLVPSQVPLSTGQQFVLSLGAGLYEELLFRVLVVGGLVWALTRFGVEATPAAIAAVVVSALVFSLSHYAGPYGDAFTAGSFVFRFIGGLAFSAIFVLRGFGIVAWTHALYDVYFLLFLRR